MPRSEFPGAGPFLPERPSLKALGESVQACRGCDLYERATQAVMGEGRKSSRAMLIGEQPGDQEDLHGRPFVGSAGRILDRALEAAGVARKDVYVTNVVKHFKWTGGRGKRRIHSNPNASEIEACRPWLEAELMLVEPEVVVAMGATAARSLFGASFRVTKEHGLIFESPWAPQSLATLHPAAIVRMPADEDRRRAFDELVADLKSVAEALNG